MSVGKVIEITAESTESFEDAIRQGVRRANQTVKNVQSAWVKEQQVIVEGGEAKRFRVNLKVTFLLD